MSAAVRGSGVGLGAGLSAGLAVCPALIPPPASLYAQSMALSPAAPNVPSLKTSTRSHPHPPPLLAGRWNPAIPVWPLRKAPNRSTEEPNDPPRGMRCERFVVPQYDGVK